MLESRRGVVYRPLKSDGTQHPWGKALLGYLENTIVKFRIVQLRAPGGGGGGGLIWPPL